MKFKGTLKNDAERQITRSAIAEFLESKYPGMSRETARDWAKLIDKEEHNIVREFAKKLGHKVIEPEISDELMRHIEEAREEFYEATERETLNPEESPEKLNAEAKKAYKN